MRKGSILIALSLLLAMMMGMSVHAREARVYDLENDIDREQLLTTILYPGDKIKYAGGYDIVIDDDMDNRQRKRGETYECAASYRVDGINSEAPTAGFGGSYYYTIYLTSYTPEPTPEPAPDNSNNDVNVEDNKEEPKVEEPKENEEQIFTRELLTSVADAKAGDSKEVDATVWHSFNANVLKELLSKDGVSYTFYYNYGGECFYITIPAGAVLEEGCEWYGPLKLNAMFGRTMIDKKDLHAAINE